MLLFLIFSSLLLGCSHWLVKYKPILAFLWSWLILDIPITTKSTTMHRVLVVIGGMTCYRNNRTAGHQT
jgi:hypothetical protein